MLQVVLNKQEKEKLVITLHKEGKTIRQIAHEAHISFTD
jgi:DNA-binding NarL/FixJ family response regulator